MKSPTWAARVLSINSQPTITHYGSNKRASALWYVLMRIAAFTMSDIPLRDCSAVSGPSKRKDSTHSVVMELISDVKISGAGSCVAIVKTPIERPNNHVFILMILGARTQRESHEYQLRVQVSYMVETEKPGCLQWT